MKRVFLKKGYEIVDGQKNMTVELNNSDKRTRKKRTELVEQ